MNATISQLWETGRAIISFDGSEFDRPTTFTELKKCSNVIVGGKGPEGREVLIDDKLHLVAPGREYGVGGTMLFLEII